MKIYEIVVKQETRDDEGKYQSSGEVYKQEFESLDIPSLVTFLNKKEV